MLVLDTGDALVGGGSLGDSTRGEALVAGMNLMGYDAMALGPRELGLGLDLLRRRMDEAQFPILSANAVAMDTKALIAEPHVVLELAGHRIALIGLTRPPLDPIPGIEVQDPREALERSLAEVAGQASSVFVLTNLDIQSALRLADAVPGIDLVIGALPGGVPEEILQTPNTATWVVAAEQPLPRYSGRYVGRLLLTIDSQGHLSDGSWASMPLTAEIPDSVEMRLLLDSFRPPSLFDGSTTY